MNKTLKCFLVSFVAVVVIIATLGAYFLWDGLKSPANNIAFAFIIFAEIALFGFIIAVGFIPKLPNNLFLNVGGIVGISLYLVTTVIIYVVSYSFFNNITNLLAIEIIAITVLFVFIVVFIMFASKINYCDQKTITESRLMQICEKCIFDLTNNNKNSQYTAQLTTILEELKYMDKIGATYIDEKIVGTIMKLEKELASPTPDPSIIFEELSGLILQRNFELSDIKRGKF